ncbi:Phytoalexin-deficient 4-2 protein [Dorcoceras hygrometricum]|uniref:Phytoalexin-deficient 4-2 protein n=1 Tax=Dorcoceras hygrometricum TaxID=472368 RepID=A0A2Z7C465_9LAMI|nr:Phytoalexin-deficient 4-2 protein [Dorcoceras hygrometricum]
MQLSAFATRSACTLDSLGCASPSAYTRADVTNQLSPVSRNPILKLTTPRTSLNRSSLNSSPLSWNQQMEKRICISAGEFLQALFQSKFFDNDDGLYRGRFSMLAQIWNEDKLALSVSNLPCSGAGITVYKRDDRRADDRYRKEERYRRDDEENERNVEKSKDKFKERSSDRKMKTNSNKRFSRKHDRKVLVAEESTKSWADSDSDSSSSSSSSSDSEQDEVYCFMADQTDEDEVFDFSNVEFTRDDLVITLNDMVKEYRKLSHSFEEAKAENISLKSSSVESISDELEDVDILKTELSKLQAENELLRNEISKLKAEVAKSTVEMSSWNKANLTLQKLYESQKRASDKTGIGFNNSEFSEGETSTQSRSA